MKTKMYKKVIKGREYYYRLEKAGKKWKWVYIGPVKPIMKVEVDDLPMLLLEKIKELDRTKYKYAIRDGVGYEKLEEILKEAFSVIKGETGA